MQRPPGERQDEECSPSELREQSNPGMCPAQERDSLGEIAVGGRVRVRELAGRSEAEDISDPSDAVDVSGLDRAIRRERRGVPNPEWDGRTHQDDGVEGNTDRCDSR